MVEFTKGYDLTSSQLLASLLAALQSSSICSNTRIEEIQEFSTEQFLIKLRTSLNKVLKLQIRIYKNYLHIDYSYQVYEQSPVMRWDNAEHFPDITTYPHHFHTQDGDVVESPLTGKPEMDVYLVLNILESLV